MWGRVAPTMPALCGFDRGRRIVLHVASYLQFVAEYLRASDDPLAHLRDFSTRFLVSKLRITMPMLHAVVRCLHVEGLGGDIFEPVNHFWTDRATGQPLSLTEPSDSGVCRAPASYLDLLAADDVLDFLQQHSARCPYPDLAIEDEEGGPHLSVLLHFDMEARTAWIDNAEIKFTRPHEFTNFAKVVQAGGALVAHGQMAHTARKVSSAQVCMGVIRKVLDRAAQEAFLVGFRAKDVLANQQPPRGEFKALELGGYFFNPEGTPYPFEVTGLDGVV